MLFRSDELADAGAFVTASGCSVLVGREPAGRANELLWHISVAHPSRYPTWDELADVRYALVPDDVTMALMLPPRLEYLNLHEFCFHLWQVAE